MTAANPITDSKFNALKQKLRELFELDKSDLDFGIYRIMAAKNKEVTEFLDRQLRDVVRETLASHGAGAAGRVQTELGEKIAGLKDDGLSDEQIDDYPAVKKLRAALEGAGGATAEELEADIYNHLLAFFSRYYDEGDFISKRRYKGDAYAIPYSGEEVVVHWANKDQYYIKSGEWHKDYRFKIGVDSGKTARIRLLQATQEAGNNKEADDAKRRFIVCADHPVDARDPDELTIHFEFRVPTENEKAAVAESEATRIFGGKYDKARARTKGDEREQFAAYAEKVALDAMPEAWRRLVCQPAPSNAKPNRTVFGKHLDDFTARNTFDYFIHKDLGGFLHRELDFYIKNEIIRLDDLEAVSDAKVSSLQSRVKAVRLVASRIIDFLAGIEDFQRRLWLKRKLVLNTHWLVTVDRVSQELRDTVAHNDAQWTEWEQLGFKPESDSSAPLRGPDWRTRAYLDACQSLVVNTRLFDDDFTARLLASEEALGDASTIDDATIGLLIDGENFGALNLLTATYHARVDCVYVDPPYNTGEREFVYKDGYKHSSWASLFIDRAVPAIAALSDRGSFLCSLDDTEDILLRGCMRSFPRLTRLGEYAWKTRNTDNRIVTRFSLDHEQIHLWAVSGIAGRVIDRSHYENPDSDPRGPYVTDPLTGKANAAARPNLHYTITNEETGDVYPPDPDFGWITDPAGFEVLLKDNRVYWPQNPTTGKPRKKRFRSEMGDRAPASSLGISISQGEGNEALLDCFGFKAFSFPKPPSAIASALDWSCGDRGIVMDYFAGSGTTGHAVLLLNRADGGTRRFVLVEMGRYFHTVLRPRIAKLIYSPEWSSGKARNHEKGISALVKCLAVESYEDVLNNLPAPEQSLIDQVDAATKDAIITYSLDLDLGPHILSLDLFRDPWSVSINAKPTDSEELQECKVDLVETFNFLLGLKVHAYGPIERYSAEFKKAKHNDELGRLKVVGRFRRDTEGPFVFQRVEGVLNDGNNTRVLVIWRTLTDDPEQDAAALDAWIGRHREDTRERSEHRDYHRIYVNGPVTLAQPTQEIRTVFPIEQTFKDRMFADTDGSEAV